MTLWSRLTEDTIDTVAAHLDARGLLRLVHCTHPGNALRLRALALVSGICNRSDDPWAHVRVASLLSVNPRPCFAIVARLRREITDCLLVDLPQLAEAVGDVPSELMLTEAHTTGGRLHLNSNCQYQSQLTSRSRLAIGPYPSLRRTMCRRCRPRHVHAWCTIRSMHCGRNRFKLLVHQRCVARAAVVAQHLLRRLSSTDFV